MLIGVGILLYPVVATYYNNWNATQFAKQFNKSPVGQDSAANQQKLEQARAYNAAMPPSILADPWRAGGPEKNDDYKYYLNQVASSQEAIARLRIPSIKVELPVFHTTTDEALSKGAGHVYGTSLPVGGTSTLAALAAHRGLPTSTMFDRVPDMKVGDEMFVDVLGETLAYRVTSVKTVLPDDVKNLMRVDGKDQLALVTCTPYGINTHRVIVVGDRIPFDQAKDANWEAGFDWTVQAWMWTHLIAGGATLLLMVGMVVRWIAVDRRKRRLEAPKLSPSDTESRALGAEVP